MTKLPPKRVFVNDIDSYSSKHIAKFLSDFVVGAHGEDDEEGESLASNSTDKAFKVVGTVSETQDRDLASVTEQYFKLTREELFLKLMECDVIIYNITQHKDQVKEALWAVTSLQKKLNNFPLPKMFILVSTVMTWGNRKPLNPEEDFTDEDFRRRRPHPNFKAHNDLERVVVKLGKMNKDLLSTYVIVSGMQYGMGEFTFHYFFKGLKPRTPVFGDGTNIVPTIHINDLASVIQNVIEHKPKPVYLLAVDDSNNTLEEIVQAISNALGSGKIEKIPIEEAFIIREISDFELHYMTVNLRMEAAHLKELLSIPWQCEKGLVETIDQVAEEYTQNRGLLPIRICVMGPPAVGKSTLAQKICAHYKLHHVQLKSLIPETLTQLEEKVNEDLKAEDQSIDDAAELLNNLNRNMEENRGVLEHQLLLKILREKLISKPCRNQGFVLDGFPKTYDDARELFENEEEEDASSNKIVVQMPEFVFFLDANDLMLKERVMNLPEAEVEENNSKHFLKKQSKYKQKKKQDLLVIDFYDQYNIPTLNLEVSSNNEHDCQMLMGKIIETVGPPRNYGPSIEEVEEEERRIINTIQMEELQKRAEEEEKEAEAARERTARWEKWSKASEELKRQEEEELEAGAAQMKAYMLEHVVPTLSQGLVACCEARPLNPIEFLGEYLVKNNPANSKFM